MGAEDTEDECSCAIVGERGGDAAGEDWAARYGVGGRRGLQGEGARLTFDDG